MGSLESGDLAALERIVPAVAAARIIPGDVD